MLASIGLGLVFLAKTLAWDYFEGGDDWGGICTSGDSQSPINLKDSIVTKITSDDDIMAVTLDLIGEFKAQFSKGLSGSIGASGSFGTIKMNSIEVSIINFHFHSPSEHTINGDYMDIELHLVGSDEDNRSYEMVFFFNAGEDDNKFIANAITSYKEEESKSFDTAWIMENGVIDNFYYYDGSISAPFPDCYEDCEWMIVADILDMSDEQLEFFSDMYKNNNSFAGGRGNNRKVQKLNGRKVYLHTDGSESSSFGMNLVLSLVTAVASLVI